MDVARILENQAKVNPDKPALVFQNLTISFSRLRDIVFQLSDGLKGLGIKRQDKIAIYLPNSPEYVYSYLAAWCLGLTVVPLDFMLTEEELVSCITHSQARTLIAKPRSSLSLSSIEERCPGLKNIVVSQGSGPFLSFEELFKKGKKSAPDTLIDNRDYAIIFYTSGTTGKPKGVLVNYLQLGAPAEAMKYFVDFKEDDIILCALPLSHLGGLVYLQNNIAFALTMILMERFTPLEFLKNIQRYRVTCLWIVPSMYYALLQLKEFEDLDLSSLRWIVSFGAASSSDALRRFHQYCPQAHFLNGWGLTETNAPTTVIPMGSDKLESVGRPAPWIEVKIFDENDKEAPHGGIGEIVVRGWVVTDGYYKDPEATAYAMRNGWFHTGDLGRLDSEGFIYIAGRKKEMIKVGGEIVFEPEVEAVLHKHPEVAEAATIGIPDKLRGEVPKAFVVLKDDSRLTKEDLRYFCRGQLAHFKVPHHFEFVPVLPKNSAGKIDKEKLRKSQNE
ncbi:MAG: AMP-binding protein [Candidatus Omnitrophota bacterium]